MFFIEDLIRRENEFLRGSLVGLTIQILVIGLNETERPVFKREKFREEEEEEEEEVNAISLRLQKQEGGTMNFLICFLLFPL